MQKKNVFASILVFFVGFMALAQEDLPPPEAMNTPPPPGQLPIDSNIVILLVVALGFGIYKSYQYSRRNA
ncbi:hypothetical protein [Winogradskyella arenosi]|uniref:Signal peptidase n=1 Tax=Winogradskyella arenosi TaxID=533325 RepID=A0A368ZIP4_9FLAO|nr:hypothetical protein [Winogradskyella arenosi]RCW93650.1 hypothetical protein DFQ08_101447 [Winogradskyella arenosi]